VVGVQAIPAGLLVTVTIGTGQTQPYCHVYLVRKGAAARLLTATDESFPAFDGKSIFAVHFSVTGIDPTVVSRIDLTGRVLARHKLPPTSALSRDTVKGLLVAKLGNDAQSSTLQLLDRSTFKVTKTLGKIGWVVAGSGSTRVAWTDSQCQTTCTLITTDLSNGRQRVVPAEAGFSISVAAFSPDGNRVAIAYYGRHPEQGGGAAAGFVDVVDLTTGARHRVPGVATDIKQAADLSWTPDGHFLAIAVGITDKDYRVVGLWPASGGAVQIVLPRVPGGYDGGALLAL
jgi:DNA-binding beta-propeller fold protein YncE